MEAIAKLITTKTKDLKTLCLSPTEAKDFLTVVAKKVASSGKKLIMETW